MSTLETMGVEFDVSNHSYKQIQINQLKLNSKDNNKIYWLHCDSAQPDSFKLLAKQLNLSDEIIQFCDQDETMPKLMDTGDALTMRVQCLVSLKAHGKRAAKFITLILHLTPKYCLTVASGQIPPLLNFMGVYPKALKYAKTPCFILFLILDSVINEYSEILFNFETVAEKIELHLRSSQRNHYNEVMNAKSQVVKIKRYTVSIRDMLMRISGRKIIVISEQCRQSLVNLFDHSQTIVTEADAVRDILNGILEQIDNSLMHKISESMNVLTVFAAILLPLTLIAGIYGMNFHWMPELQWKYGYLWALSLMAITAGILIWIFKRKKWF